MRVHPIRARTAARWVTEDGRGGPWSAPFGARAVQLKMQRVVTVLKRTEEVRDVRMVHGFAGIVGDQVLFRDIGHVVALIVFGQKMVERLFFYRAAVFGNGGIPFLCVVELRVNIEHDTTKRMLLVAYDLSEVIFCASLQHDNSAPMPLD